MNADGWCVCVCMCGNSKRAKLHARISVTSPSPSPSPSLTTCIVPIVFTHRKHVLLFRLLLSRWLLWSERARLSRGKSEIHAHIGRVPSIGSSAVIEANGMRLCARVCHRRHRFRVYTRVCLGSPQNSACTRFYPKLTLTLHWCGGNTSCSLALTKDMAMNQRPFPRTPPHAFVRHINFLALSCHFALNISKNEWNNTCSACVCVCMSILNGFAVHSTIYSTAVVQHLAIWRSVVCTI